MLESCVAPILVLIISMFYKKNEQVCYFFLLKLSSQPDTLLGSTYHLVLYYGMYINGQV